MLLKDTAIRSLKPTEKPFKKADGGGLYLLVDPRGSKLWRMDYRYHGKRKTLSGGQYPHTSLNDARRWRDEVKAQLARGEDPSLVRREVKRQARLSVDATFEKVSREWYDARKDSWTPRYAALVLGRLEDDIFPAVGRLPIADIDGPILLDALKKIEDRGAYEMAHRVKNHCGEIFRYGVAKSYCRRDPSRDITDALKRPPKVKHRAKIHYTGLGAFYQRLNAYDLEPITKLALRFTIMTWVRTQETRFAAWTEFERLDSDEPLWRLSEERMKMSREHLVPLPRQAVSLLEQIRALNPKSPYLFPHPSSRSGFISENRMLYALYRLGYHGKATVHGFRGTASTWANEHHYNSDWIEKQLAHDEEDDVRGAYNSAEWLPGRRQMLQDWADFLEREEAMAELVG